MHNGVSQSVSQSISQSLRREVVWLVKNKYQEMQNEKSRPNFTCYRDICQQQRRKAKENSQQNLFRVEICLQDSGIHNKSQDERSLLVIRSYSPQLLNTVYGSDSHQCCFPQRNEILQQRSKKSPHKDPTLFTCRGEGKLKQRRVCIRQYFYPGLILNLSKYIFRSFR